MKKYKNFILFAILLSLSAITFWLLNKKETPQESAFSTGAEFSISMGASPDKIVLQNKQNKTTQVLSETAGEWYLNGKIKIKPELHEALTLILKRLKIKRPFSTQETKEVLPQIDAVGVGVKIFEGEKLLNEFTIWGNKESKTTYAKFAEENKAYVVDIPGYSTYIAAIFFYGENQWANNLLFTSTWRSFKSMKVQYPKDPKNSFMIEFNGTAFEIPGIEKLDTAALLNYLEDFSKIKFQKIPSPDKIKANTLLKTAPEILVDIEDIDSANTNTYSFFIDTDNPNSPVKLLNKHQEVGVISNNSFKKIVQLKNAFRKNKDK